jgi:WD repeat-containing protein 70
MKAILSLMFLLSKGFPGFCLMPFFSPTGGQLLVCAGKSTVKLFNRDGVELQETLKGRAESVRFNFELGDMYITDMRHTKGHVSNVTCGSWHPTDKNIFMTSSLDSTIRIWDITSKPIGIEQNLMQRDVIKLRTSPSTHGKVAITACAYSKDGGLIAGGGKDGCLQIWAQNAHYVRPQFYLQHAHLPNIDISSLCFFKDSHKILSRACDDTMKLWDLRAFKKPVHVWEELDNFFPKTQVSLSPDEKYVLTGTSAKEKQGHGFLMIYSTQTFERIAQLAISQAMVIRVIWHEKINQYLFMWLISLEFLSLLEMRKQEYCTILI